MKSVKRVLYSTFTIIIVFIIQTEINNTISDKNCKKKTEKIENCAIIKTKINLMNNIFVLYYNVEIARTK